MTERFDLTDQPGAPLLRLFYTSSAIARLGARELALACEKRNREAGITGVLLRVDATYLQVIEGAPKAIAETFERICCDLRHRNLALLEIEPADERIFGDWSMGHVGDSESLTIALRDDLEDIRLLAGVNAHNTVLRMRQLLDAVRARDLEVRNRAA
ncbi:MAG: blue light sensor protein [Sphingomonadales bacterium CG12_big_fil_rev_8_21_14_0_65_65_10]|uniref:BLUF domain-containing protein n=1 Tax=Blastomonas marina TaxID=1867408 RepID=UPI000CBF2FAD|nr:BLUF domain-containing protein [Blastomonas marina]PIW54266.1 MAG: blue light sensor protein [Sphingomonadales bacterium CG12_big_fil_rev_8_21_14_0_65_65_10]WPZ04209.1 BLUF domain-containing protein [Blastomonas marina]